MNLFVRLVTFIKPYRQDYNAESDSIKKNILLCSVITTKSLEKLTKQFIFADKDKVKT